MIMELVEHYEVREFWAVLKRENHRSMRLLERLGFLAATPGQQLDYPLEPDEALMTLFMKGAELPPPVRAA